MKKLVFVIGVMVSFNVFAESCEGIFQCADLYSSMTKQKLKFDKDLDDKSTLALNETDLTKKNAKKEFTHFLNMNGIGLEGNYVHSKREGEFNTSPIYIVTADNVPQMINKDGLVTFIYQTKRETGQLVDGEVRGLLPKKVANRIDRIVEFKKNKIILVSSTYEYAEKIIRRILELDSNR